MMAELINKDGKSLILVAQNSGKMKVFDAACSTGEIVRLKGDDMYAIIHYESGEKERREFYYGSGYLSSSSRLCRVSRNVVSVKITSYSGVTRIITF